MLLTRSRGGRALKNRPELTQRGDNRGRRSARGAMQSLQVFILVPPFRERNENTQIKIQYCWEWAERLDRRRSSSSAKVNTPLSREEQ